MGVTTASEVRLGGHQIEVPTPLARVGIASDFQQDWKADQYRIWSYLDSQKGLHLTQKHRAKMRQLDSDSIAMSKPSTSFIGG
jgi:hypothetical protein